MKNRKLNKVKNYFDFGKKDAFVTKLFFNPLSANSTKWSNTFKQFVAINRQII